MFLFDDSHCRRSCEFFQNVVNYTKESNHFLLKEQSCELVRSSDLFSCSVFVWYVVAGILSLWLSNVFRSFSDSAEKPTHIRFLVSNAAAGSVIGKGGSTITEFQAKSGARIQLSRNQEFFPGTTDRIIMISGSIKEVVNGLELILDKLHSEVIVFQLVLD